MLLGGAHTVQILRNLDAEEHAGSVEQRQGGLEEMRAGETTVSCVQVARIMSLWEELWKHV